MQHQEKTALSRQALGGLVPIVTFVALLHNRAQIKQASNQMRRIALTGKHGTGQYALVSDEDYDHLSSITWTLTKDGYVTCYRGFMHRLIMQPPLDKLVDHRNGVRHDNTRENLRICTHKLNMQNRAMSSSNKTGFKGVSMSGSLFKAQIRVEGEQVSLGSFTFAESAAHAYDAAALIYFGEYARLNSYGLDS